MLLRRPRMEDLLTLGKQALASQPFSALDGRHLNEAILSNRKLKVAERTCCGNMSSGYLLNHKYKI